MLAKLRIGPKLLLAPVLVLILLIISSSAAYYAMVRQNQSLETIVHVRAERTRQAADLLLEAQRAHSAVYQVLSWMGASFPQARVEALRSEVRRHHAALQGQFASMLADSAAGSAERRHLEQGRAAHALYLGAINDVLELSRADHSVSANAMVRSEQAFGAVAASLDGLGAHQRQQSERAAQQAAREFTWMARSLPALVAVSIALSLALTMAVRRSLLQEVRSITEVANDLASGNLTLRKRAYGRDEIGDTSRVLDSSIRHLNETLLAIRASAESIGSASREFADGSDAAASDAARRLAAIVNAAQQIGAAPQQGGMGEEGMRDDGIGKAGAAAGHAYAAAPMTQQHAALVQQAAAAAQRLQQQALGLSKTVAAFRLDDGAGTAESTPAPSAQGGRKRHLWLASDRS